MNRLHPFRSLVSLMLVIAIVGMIGPRSAMAMPVAMVKMTHQTGSLHEQMKSMDDMSSRHVIAQAVDHNGHHILCDCAASGCLCAASNAAIPSASAVDFSDRFTVPTGPANLNLADSTITLDPPPPRV